MKKNEVFRAAEGTSYFEDSHMQTPVKTRSSKKTPSRCASRSSRNIYLHGAADKTELGGGDNEDDEPSNRGGPDDSINDDYSRHLSFNKKTCITSKSAPMLR
ncbi:hypothetical protein PC128_g5535 [Phytophthora cactorum]|nr:hypothetical protein PC128_g5535 [Phytophthora cactorum]